jgi:hypothetical protein
MQESTKNDDFIFIEHYKMNTGIFKNNFLLIIQIMIEDIYNSFSCLNEMNNQDYPH